MMSGQTWSVCEVTCFCFNDPTALIRIITRQAERGQLAKSQTEFSVTAECQVITFLVSRKQEKQQNAQGLYYN